MRIFGGIRKYFSGLSSPRRSWGWVVREPFSGAWQRNQEITKEDVLCQSTLYSCVNLIASDVAKMRFVSVRQQPSGVWREEWDDHLTPLLKRPNGFQNHIQFKESWVLSKLLDGNTYVLLMRGDSGQVVRMFVLDPSRVRPLVSDSGEVFYSLSFDNLTGVDVNDGNQLIVPASEIIHDRWNTFYHPLCGIGPVRAAYLSASQSLRIQKSQDSFFENSAMPGGILTAPGHIQDDTAKRAKEYFEEEFTGDSAGKIAVLGDGLKFDRLAMSSVDAQLVQQLKYTAEQICGVFHVPQHMVFGPVPTNNNAEMLQQSYYSQCLQALIESIEECMDNALGLNNLPSGNLGVELDLSMLLRMDTLSRYKANADGIKGSFLTINEARMREDLEPVPGGDTVYMQQQNYSLEALAERDRHSPLLPVDPASTSVDETTATTETEATAEVVDNSADSAEDGEIDEKFAAEMFDLVERALK